jgi:hypothetical protein
MATIFLGCFIFGALFTAASFVLGFGGHGGPGLHHGGVGHAGQTLHAGHAVAHHAPGADQELPLFNASSLLAFLTLFGAVGYILTSYAEWVLLPALIGAVLAGLLGWLAIAMLLRTVLAGEVELDPADFRMEGTLGQVTSAIPPHGSGETVFTMGGTHHGEAARTADGRPLARGTEVVITHYEHGFATVEPWADYMAASDIAHAAQKQPPELHAGE